MNTHNTGYQGSTITMHEVLLGAVALVGVTIWLGAVIIDDWKAQRFKKRSKYERPATTTREVIESTAEYVSALPKRRDTVLAKHEGVLRSAKPEAPQPKEHKGNG